MKINPPEFEGILNPDLYIKWIQAFERFFKITEHSNKKAFKVVVLKLKKCASLSYENTKRQRAKEGRPQIKPGPNIRSSIINGSCRIITSMTSIFGCLH